MLIAIIGDLGSGKTLTLTFFALMYYVSNRTVYANYHLAFPHVYVSDINMLNEIRYGGFFGDELWLWIDSRASSSARNRFVSMILAKSRKRKLDIFYTTQIFRQIDLRIRRLTDIIIIPNFDRTTNVCKVEVFNKAGERIKRFSYRGDLLFNLYDTEEEITQEIDYNFYIKELRSDKIFSRLKRKSAQIQYIRKKFAVSKDEASLILELYLSSQSSQQ